MRRALLALCLAPLAPAAAGAEARIAPEARARVEAAGSAAVLVELALPARPEGELAGEAARAAQRARIAAEQDALLEEMLGTEHSVHRRFRSIPFVGLRAGREALAALERSPRVAAVEADRLHRPVLDVSVPRVEADQTAALGYDGAGQAVAVLDTGADAAHPNLQGKLAAEACFALGDPPGSGDCPNGLATDLGPGAGAPCSWSDDCFHGTHVAGIAVGGGPSYSGVARGAELVAIQVFSRFRGPDCAGGPSPCALSYVSDQVAALEHVFDVLRLDHAVAAVNMSLGGLPYTSQPVCDAANAATKAAIDNLRSVGIATAAAAGNDGYVNAIGEPACISSAVSVSAVDDADQIPSFANAAAFLSLWAPGVAIRAPFYGTTGYVDASGTSMATPHAAGAFAILRQAAPAATVPELLERLQSTGVAIPDVYAATSRIRIRAALAPYLPACANGADDDGDGLVDLADPGCADASDASERSLTLGCDDGEDDDGDGAADYPADPGCRNPSWPLENPQCQDGLDNDGQPGIDFDGGAFLNGGTPIDAPDPQCTDGWKNREAASACGLGFELALLAPLAARLLRARRRRGASLSQ